jgi:branched-chain amino acid transport system permease protein
MKVPAMNPMLRAVLGLAALVVVGWPVLGVLPAATVSVLVLGLYYAVAATSFNFLYGSLGVFSLAQPVFLAVGGYTGIYFSNESGVSPWLAMPIAAVFAGVLALPVALVAVRAGGSAVLTALITLIVSQAITPILISIEPLGGAVGLYADVDAEGGFWSMQFADPASFARIFLIMNAVLIGLWVAWRHSRFGYYVAAIKDSPDASAAVGVHNSLVKIVVFVLAAMIAAPAGVVYAQYNLLTTPDLFLGAVALFQVIVAALVGGAARPWGSLVGALLIVYVSKEVSDLAGGRPGIGPLTFAVVFIVMALLMPRGISGTWAALVERRADRAGRSSSAAAQQGADGPNPPAEQNAAPMVAH